MSKRRCRALRRLFVSKVGRAPHRTRTRITSCNEWRQVKRAHERRLATAVPFNEARERARLSRRGER